MLIWLIIGLTYLSVTHAYGDLAAQMTLSRVLLLTAASVAGGVIAAVAGLALGDLFVH